MFSNIFLTKQKSLITLGNLLKNDKEALMQILLSLCKPKTLNRIERCPTYPLVTITSDLEERLKLLTTEINSNSFDISTILGFLYEKTVGQSQRKSYGQYFTPNQIAKEAISLLEITNDEFILDPGCGTGIFPVSILQINKEKSEFLDSLYYLGIENDPFLALSSAIVLDWINAPKNWRILYANFLLVTLNDILKINTFNNLKKIDVIISNPPFVRYHKLGKRNEIASNLQLSMLSGLHTYFLAHSARLLKEGRMVFILPIEMNTTKYGIDIFNILKSKFKYYNEYAYYDNNNSWKINKELTFNAQSERRGVIQISLFKSYNNIHFKSHKTKIITKGDFLPLSSFASVHRGTSTGSNNFFILTDKLVSKYEIPINYLNKVIPTKIPKEKLPDIFENKNWNEFRNKGYPCWLLSLPKTLSDNKMPLKIREYLTQGEQRGIPLLPTCKNRQPWYYIRVSSPPDIIFTYIFRNYPKFIYNKDKMNILTNLLGIHFNTPSFKTDEIISLVQLLNQEIRENKKLNGRRYSGGLIKYEPSELETLELKKSELEKIGIHVKTFDYK